MPLTPESTGTSPDPAAARKARRQTAFYPNMNAANKPQKPFSRSAAKRESVMMLGSIEHLQHYFTKTGIAAKKNALATHKGLVPALGGTLHIRNTSSISRDMLGVDLPPSPIVPPSRERQFPPVLKTFETDPDSLLPGVVDDLNAVSHAWCIDETPPSTPFDVLGALKITTRTVRAIRNYVLSLPDESAGTIRAQYRSKQLGPGAIKQRQSDSSHQQDPLTLIRRSAISLLEVLRELEERSRLPLSDDAYDAQSEGSGSARAGAVTPEVGRSPAHGLGIIDLPSERDGDGMLSTGDAALSYSLIQVEGRLERVPVWEDEDDIHFDNEEERKEKREGWDERLVVDHGWLYKQDIQLDSLVKERNAVTKYLDDVDEVLFNGKQGDERGWDRAGRRLAQRSRSRTANRRASAGLAENKKIGAFFSGVPIDKKNRRVTTGMMNLMGELSLTEEPEGMEGISEDAENIEEGEGETATDDTSLDDDQVPAWARRGAFGGDELARAHAVLSDGLPAHLREVLAPPSSRDAFLGSLSSGQLLCLAYNACVRRSKKPWGYVNPDGIHDIIALMKADEAGDKKEGSKSGWTFRRIDNLRLWIGAMKLRYLLPIQQPGLPTSRSGASPTPSASPSAMQTQFTAPLIFDVKVVARRDEGWQDMLESVLLSWVDIVVEEKRGER